VGECAILQYLLYEYSKIPPGQRGHCFCKNWRDDREKFSRQYPPEAVFASYLIRLRLIDEKVLPEFLSLFFQTTGYWKSIKDGSTGSAQGGFNATKLAALCIPIPPLPEQKRIVAILDEAFEGITAAVANAEKNLANARELFDNYLNSVVAEMWDTCELVSLSELATDITDGDHLPPPKAVTGIPFITIGNINKETRAIDFTNTFMVPQEYFNGLKPNRKPKKGDVLYTVTGSFGIPVIVQDDFKFCFQRHIGLIRPNAETQSAWLHYLLLSPQVFRQANEGATGTAQKTVSLKVLRSFKVPRVLPPQQRSAVTVLDALAAETRLLEGIYQQKLNNLAELKQAILQKAFAGELTAQPEKALRKAAAA
jgi:type I restriction enzyme S subunit